MIISLIVRFKISLPSNSPFPLAVVNYYDKCLIILTMKCDDHHCCLFTRNWVTYENPPTHTKKQVITLDADIYDIYSCSTWRDGRSKNKGFGIKYRPPPVSLIFFVSVSFVQIILLKSIPEHVLIFIARICCLVFYRTPYLASLITVWSRWYCFYDIPFRIKISSIPSQHMWTYGEEWHKFNHFAHTINSAQQ